MQVAPGRKAGYSGCTESGHGTSLSCRSSIAERPSASLLDTGGCCGTSLLHVDHNVVDQTKPGHSEQRCRGGAKPRDDKSLGHIQEDNVLS